MRFLIAPDKFKGSLTATAAADLISSLLRRDLSDAEIISFPLADGGDGTLEVLSPILESVKPRVKVHDPLGRNVEASFGLHRAAGKTIAIIETSAASGLSLLKAEERNPLQTSSFGTGELVLAALQSGARDIRVALGGTATVDGGLGFLRALGAEVRFNPSSRKVETTAAPFSSGGGVLPEIESIDLFPAFSSLQGARLTGWCDVKLSLLGPRGARMFMPQKGATPSDAERLEAGLSHWAQVLSRACGRSLLEIEGTGAAGGFGLALLALDGSLESGFESIAQMLDLETAMKDCDIVVTGEGTLDEGSRGGKTPVGVARLARRWGKPCVALCGAVESGLRWLAEEGLTRVYPLYDSPLSPGDLRMEKTASRMKEAVRRLTFDLDDLLKK